MNGLTQNEIALLLGMSTGWTYETLAAIRSQCGSKNGLVFAFKPPPASDAEEVYRAACRLALTWRTVDRWRKDG